MNDDAPGDAGTDDGNQMPNADHSADARPDPAASADTTSTTDPADRADRADRAETVDVEQFSAALMIRAWAEPGDPLRLRARLLTSNNGAAPTPWSTAAGIDGVSSEVRRWLRQLRARWQTQGGSSVNAPDTRDGALRCDPLVDGDWLQQHLSDPDVVVLEVDDDVDRYGRGHVPGAVRLHWLDDLRHPGQRAPLHPVAFARLLDRYGISAESRVVLYSGRSNTLAANAYWTFYRHGHRQLSLLNGGRAAWVSEGRPTTTQPSGRRPSTGYPVEAVPTETTPTRGELLGSLGSRDLLTLVDCRTPGEFTGADDPDGVDRSQRVRGHMPGAVNLPVDLLISPDQRLLPRAVLLQLCRERGLRADDRLVVYCSAADRSALVWFVLHELLRWPDVRCYLGAWAEYGALVGAPVEQGLPAPH